MKRFQIKGLLAIFVMYTALSVNANDMQSSFNDAMEFGKKENGLSNERISSFDPSSVSDNFTASPNEINLKGNANNLSSMGTSELNNSDVGKVITESTINNPKVKISEDADFLKNSEEIRQNSSVISGIKSSKQCVKKVLNKTSFTNHFCEKDNAVSGTCSIKKEVKWIGEKAKKTVNKEMVLRLRDMKRTLISGYSTVVEHSISENITVTGFDFYFKNTGLAFDYRYYPVDILGVKHEIRLFDYASHTVSERNLSYTLNKGDNLRISFLKNWFGFIGGFKRISLWNRFNSHIKVYYKVEEDVDTLRAELEEVSSCKADDENRIEVASQCIQKGGTKTFIKNGKSVELTADCWENKINYVVSDASDNECKSYESNPNCTVAERECVLDVGGNCTRFRNQYQCSVTTKTDGYLCGEEFFCSDGKCSDLENSVNTDFGHAVSQLANLAKANEDYDYNNQKFTAFSGRPMYCRKSGFGYSDCCKDSGWGKKVGLASCNSEEQMLGEAKEKKTTVFVGTYCDQKIFGKCVKRKSSYCVFDNKLARITQAQGRSGQLGIGFGDAKNPNCRGLTVDELKRINFKKMDYSDFYEELNSNTAIPDKDKMIDYINKSVSEQMQQ